LYSEESDLDTQLTIRSTIFILSFYILLVLPAKNIFFQTTPWIYEYTDIIYFLVIILLVLYLHNAKIFGFSVKNLKKNLILGSLSGGVVIISLFLLELGINLTGMSNLDLLQTQTNTDISLEKSSIIIYASIILMVPLIEQVFFTGIIFQSLLKKINPVLAIYASGVIYSLAGFKLSLGAFVIGVTTAILFKVTKTLYASIVFHSCCAFGGIIIKTIYPRLSTLISFIL
jgi:membrane protease YdiL (CAAX protease family)